MTEHVAIIILGENVCYLKLEKNCMSSVNDRLFQSIKSNHFIVLKKDMHFTTHDHI